MHQFGIHTFKAEINAMPCPPDEFEIEVTLRDKIGHDFTEMPPFLEYDVHVYECPRNRSTIIHYKRRKPQGKNRLSAQDLILNRFKEQMQ